MRIRGLVSILAAFCLVSLLPLCGAQGYRLKSGDTVVFYGDSITAQNFYNQWVELYTVTRFPSMRVHFYGAGVGGDRVGGGAGGPIDERLARDVFAYKPTVVTVMLGMNDGLYRASSDEVQSIYTKGYAHLLESIRTNAPGARITLLGPSPFDDVTRPVQFPGGYNAVLRHYADLNQELASKSGASYVNLNPPVVALLEKAKALDAYVGRSILPDRVHPQTIAHWVMAETLLKDWNAPALVSSVTIDAKSGRVADAQNATVDSVERGEKSLRWTELEKSLPLAFNQGNETEALLLQLTDIQGALNQEQLRITGLEDGKYDLSIDGDKVGAFPAEELQKGINLADYRTPMWRQSQRVGWIVGDREATHHLSMQMQIKKYGAGAQLDALKGFEDNLENEMYQETAPKPHEFSLSPAAGAK